MRADGLGTAAVLAFKNSYESLVSGASGMIAESDLTPASSKNTNVPKKGSGPNACVCARS